MPPLEFHSHHYPCHKLLPPLSALLSLTVQRYFAQFSSVLIVHDGHVDADSALQQDYLEAVQLAFRNLSQQGRVIGLQWIDVSQLDERGSRSNNRGSSATSDSHNNSVDNLSSDDELELCMLRAVDIVTEVGKTLRFCLCKQRK